ncbi:MAG: hypothetical protein AB2A00_27355 [Myxococcota bacterium]
MRAAPPRFPWSLLAGALLAAACQQEVGPPETQAPTGEAPPPAAGAPAGRPEITVRGESGEANLHVGDSAAILQTRWPKPEPGDRQNLELFTPDGNLYLRNTSPVPADGVVSQRLPLRGSHIEDYSMTGTWRVRVYRNSATVPAAETSFEVKL